MLQLIRLVLTLVVAVVLPWLASPALAQPAIDLPACEASAPGAQAALTIGVVQPHASEHLVNYAARLTLADPGLNICAETWRSVLPRWVPWAGQLERGLGFGVFVIAFVAAVTLLWFTTPRHWWRRTTLLGVLGVFSLTWVLGVAGLALLQLLGAQRLLYDTVVSLRVPQQAGAEWLDLKGARDLEAVLAARGVLRQGPPAEPAQPIQPPEAGQPPQPAQPAGQPPAGLYRVAHRLNLRSGPGTQHDWLATLPRGEAVTYDGAVQGDWWRVKRASGEVGWASSLWLRRPQEGLPPASAAGGAAKS